MPTVNKNYLKDEVSKEVFSPILSEKSVYTEDGTEITECVPVIHRFDITTMATTITLFSGNIPNWIMFTIYANVQTTKNDSKAINFRINETSNMGYDFIDTRYRDAGNSYYNPRSSGSSWMFIGDIAYPGNTSYLEIQVNNRGLASTWSTLKSIIGNVTGTSGQYSISTCSGQFSQYLSNLTKIELNTAGTIRATGIMEVWI